MVYCGKPSMACENCRLRRLKCDQKQPGCGPCKNTSRKCLGYREANELVFRDERQRIIQMVQKAETKKGKKGQNVSRPPSRPQMRQQKRLVKLPVHRSVAEPVEDVAVDFLLHEYLRDSHFDYLAGLYAIGHPQGFLRSTIEAVGLACLALQTSQRSLQNRGEKVYGDVITVINRSIQGCISPPSDDILASVLLMGLYETLNLQNVNTCVETWTTHMHGALAMVSLRGSDQFQSPVGMKLFKQLASSIRVFCVQSRIRIPSELRELTDIARLYSCADDVSFTFSRVVEAFTELRADFAEGILHEPREVIRRAEEVLQVMRNVQEGLPASFLYETTSLPSLDSDMHGQFYHTFANHHIAQAWNTMWMADVQLNAIIHEQVMALLQSSHNSTHDRSDLAGYLLACRQSTYVAANNICATVPSYFPTKGICVSQTTKRQRVTATGYFLIWPLFSAGSTPLVEDLTRQYAVRSLERIASDLRLPQAQKAAEMLSQGKCSENWMHMCHVF